MADDIEKLEQSAKKTADSLEKLSKVSQSTYETVKKNAKSEADAKKITDLYIRSKQQELLALRRSKDANTDAGRLKKIQLLQEIGAVRESTKKQTVLAGVTSKVTSSLKGFKVGVQATLIEGIFQLGKGIFDTTKRFIDAEERIESFSDVAKSFGDVPFLGKAATGFAKALDFNVGIFKQLAQQGATFEGSIINLRNAAHEARMPILQFVDMISHNSEIMAQLFGTVDGGVRRMGEMQKELRTVTREQLSQFGLNLDETSDYFKTYLMLEKSRGRLVLGTAQEEVAQGKAYIENLVKLSKLTGESVESLDKRNRELAANGVLQRQLLKLGPDQRNAVQGVIAQFGGAESEMGKLIAQVAAFGNATDAETALLNQMAGGQLVPLIQDLMNGRVNIGQFNNQMGQIAQSGFTSDFVGSMSNLAVVVGTGTNQINTLVKGIRAGQTSLDNETKQRDTMTSDMVAFKDTIQEAKSSAESLGTKGFGAIATAYESLKAANKHMKEQLGDMTVSETAVNADMAMISAFDPANKALRITTDKPLKTESEKRAESGYNISLSGEADSGTGIQYRKNNKGETEAYYGEGFQYGTRGFEDFGRGTPAVLHGKEAVVPYASPVGQILSNLGSFRDLLENTAGGTNTVNNINNTTPNNVDMSGFVSTFNRGFADLKASMVESQAMLKMIAGSTKQTADYTGKTVSRIGQLSGNLI